MTTLAVAAAALLCGCRTGPFTGPPVLVPPVYDSEFHPTNRGWVGPVWQDEFTGPSVDQNKWVVAQFCGGYNKESQCYTNRPENIQVGGGHLTITARTELPIEDDNDRALRCDGTDISMAVNEVGTVNCPATLMDSLQDYNYSSARIHTHVPTTPTNPSAPHTWTYGRIEIRARVPFGQGTWPAFWMLPLPSAVEWPRSGEIDILEAVNLHMFFPGSFKTDRVQSNVHFCSAVIADLDPNASNDAQAVCQLPCNASKAHKPLSLKLEDFVGTTTPDLTRSLHTYAMEWTDVKMRFFVDDQFLGEVKHGPDCQGYAPFQQPFYLIINLAIGGKWPGPPSPTLWALFQEARLTLDWVRVYACGNDPTAKNCAF